MCFDLRNPWRFLIWPLNSLKEFQFSCFDLFITTLAFGLPSKKDISTWKRSMSLEKSYRTSRDEKYHFTTTKNTYFTLKKKIPVTKLFFASCFFPNLTSFASTFANTSGAITCLIHPPTYLWLALQQRLLSFEMCKYANWFPNFFGVFLHNLIWNILSRLIIRSHYYYFSIINFIGKNNLPEASNYILYHF